jgi:iron complex outermembrane receptor protein
MQGAALSLAAFVSPVLAQSTTTADPAQDAAPASADGAEAQTGVADIVVTAQRREERLQDVPLAVSAFSGDNLAAQQIQTTLDLPRLVPNMVGTNNVGLGSANTYFIRALGNTESIATFDPPVGTYVDEIYVSRQNANNFAFFDVDRIEVLRGPQGTLFGRNTTGGAINVILKKPGRDLAGFAEASYGRFDSWTARGSIDLPVSDTLLTKFSGFLDRSDGFVRNETTGERVNGRRSYGLRGALRYVPTDTFTWDIAVDYIRDNSVNLPSREEDGRYFARTGLSKEVPGLRNLVIGRKGDFELQNVVKSLNVTSNIAVEYGDHTLSLITGYRRLRQDYVLDVFDGPFPTGGFALANAGLFKQFSQEAKLAGSFGEEIDYVAGLFYIYEDNLTDFADIFTLPFGPSGFPLVLTDRRLFNKTSAPAVYAQVNWHPTQQLTVTAGARYTSEEKTFSVIGNNNPLALANFSTPDITAFGIPTSKSTKLLTPRLAVHYDFTPDVMIFASATRGFRSGGWNARAITAQTFREFGPEKVWSYEGGLRSDLLGRRLRFNLTGFYTNVKGFQVPLGFVDASGAINFVTQNATDLRVYGLEAETTLVPTEGMSLFANIGLLNADYRNPDPEITSQQAACRGGDAAACGQGIVDPEGDLAEPQRAPHLTASFGGSYDIRLGAGDMLLTPSANASYESRKTVGTAGTDNDYVPSQWIVGASLALGPEDGPWKLSLECSNCFDKVSVGSFFPPAFFFYNPPMTWRVRGSVRF